MATPRKTVPDFTISTQNSNAQDLSSVSVLKDGRTVVTWHDLGSNSGDIKFTILNADGTVAVPETRVNSATSGNQTAPQVTALQGGGFVMVWEDFGTDANGNIAYRVYGANGQPTTGVLLANSTTSGLQQDPAVVALDGGGFAIGWVDTNPAVTDLPPPTSGAVMMREFTSTGAPVSGPVRLSGDYGGDGSPAFADGLNYSGVDDTGTDFVAVWDDSLGPDGSNADEDGIYQRSVGSTFPTTDYVNGGTRLDTNSGFRESSNNPDVATSGAVIATVWDDTVTGSVGRDIYIDFSNTGSVQRVNTVTADTQQNASVASLVGGGFVVVWETFSGASSFDVKGRTYDQNGVATSGEFLINSSSSSKFTGAQYAPDVTGLIDGRFMVTWSDPTSSGGIDAAIFDPRTARVDWTGTATSEQYVGTIFNDILNGGGGNDSVNGNAGNDTLIGAGGKDTLDGGEGGDRADYSARGLAVTVTLKGAASATVTVGGATEDTLRNIENVTGSALNDRITGDSLANSLRGGAGGDSLNGGAGKDVLEGGDGGDTFIFSSSLSSANADRITDFNGTQDRIGLENAIYGALGSSVSSTEFRLGTGAVDSNDFLIYDRPTGKLYYDSDASGGSAKVLIATLNTNTALAFDDFILV
jgi:Ca2+-binding RTX toxin-like protein